MERKKTGIVPYLPFNGNCEEALNTYIRVFGGEISYMSHWSESEYDVGPEQRKKVLHVEFTLGDLRMAAGDNVDYIETTTDVRLMIHLDSKEEALRTIDVLREEGEVLLPFHQCPTPDTNDCEAILTDRFGVTWIITCPNTVCRTEGVENATGNIMT